MKKQIAKDTMRVIAWILLGLVTVVFLGGSIALYQDTLIDWKIPVGATLVLALISASVMHRRWQWLTNTDCSTANFLCHGVFTFSIILFAFFAGNYFLADDETRHTETVIVDRKFSEERQRTRRVGRRMVRTGETYHEYFIEVRFDDGRLKKLQVPVRRYARIRTGSTLPLDIEMGYFGIPVIKTRMY